MSPTASAELSGLLTAQLAPLVAQGQTPGVVAVAVRGRDQALCWAGRPDRDAAFALDGQTRFEIGSLTKTFTALLLAQMVGCGDVGYDDPISAYLPTHALPRDAAVGQITLAQLATHTAGLPRAPRNLYQWRILRHGWSDPYPGYRLVDLYRATSRLTPRYPPGGAARYSTFGVALLGQLLANATNQPYQPLLTERVCAPLGLTATAAELLGEASPLRATGHRRGRPLPPWQLDALISSGGLRCTGVELLAYLEAHLKPESTALADALRATHTPRAATPTGTNAICLVWNHRVVDSRTLLWHTGGTRGFSTFLGFSPEAGAGVGVLANSRTRDQAAIHAGRRLFKRVVFPPSGP
jgi:CubicO group peptidase (beta-lactamase class C family)